MRKCYYVYITTNPSKKVLYTGVTNDLEQRIIEHYLNRGDIKTFAGRYFCYCLVYWEDFQWIEDAIAREKEIKGLVRRKKLELIKKTNPRLRFFKCGSSKQLAAKRCFATLSITCSCIVILNEVKDLMEVWYVIKLDASLRKHNVKKIKKYGSPHQTRSQVH